MTKQAIGYVRVSTQMQVKEGISLEAQKQTIAEWCRFYGYDLVEIYEDAGVSGKNIIKRNALKKALASLTAGMAFVTYSLTRLSRSTKDLLHIKDIVEKAKADLVFINEKIDTTTASGKVIFTILGAIGEFERNSTGERIKHTKQHNKKLGKYNGGYMQYGYSIDEQKKLCPIESEQIIINRARELHAQNINIARIGKTLEKEGLLTRNNTPWQCVQISRILREA